MEIYSPDVQLPDKTKPVMAINTSGFKRHGSEITCKLNIDIYRNFLEKLDEYKQELDLLANCFLTKESVSRKHIIKMNFGQSFNSHVCPIY